MNRRDAVLALLALGSSSLDSFAQQQTKIPRIGFLTLASAATPSPSVNALRDALRGLGWVEGQNIVIEYARADTPDGLPTKAAELVNKKVDLIFAAASTQVESARQATRTIPIVFAAHADPVGVGHIASLAHPGGNITGVSMLLTELSAKELEILKEAVPQATRIGVLWSPTTPSHTAALKAVAVAAKELGVRLTLVPVQSVREFDPALADMERAHLDALLVIASPLVTNEGVQLAAAVQKHRLPAIYGFSANADAGGLMSYGANFLAMHRRAAVYIDKILRGANPADLPVEQAQEFELVINMKTAKSLGLTIPKALLFRADRVIE